MPGPSEKPSGKPPNFALLFDAQMYMAEALGRDWRAFSRDDPATLEAARSLGIESEFVRLAEMSRELDAVVNASTRRAREKEKRGQPAADIILFDRGEPPPLDFPAEAVTSRPPHVNAARQSTSPADGAAPLPGYHVAEIWAGFTPSTYLVKHLLAPGELTVLFGQSGHFKSVIAIDLALSVATGNEYHGMRTRPAGVLYIAGEGHNGIRKRIRAWLMARHFDASSSQPSLYVTTSGGNLFGNPTQLRATAESASAALDRPIGLVIIDTLAANFGPGEENSATDMQLAISGARTAAPGAAVLLVHHVGHGQSERERGSYALIAAADCRVQATYEEVAKCVELRWHKLKDDERPEPRLFGWKTVPLDWADEDGEELTSVVLESLNGEARAAAAAGPRITGLGKNQETALRALRALLAKARKNVEDRGDDPAAACILIEGWRSSLERHGIDRRRFHEVRNDLVNRRLIVIDGPHVAPVEVEK